MRFYTLIIVNQQISIKNLFVKISFDLSDYFYFFDSLFVKCQKSLRMSKIPIISNFAVFAEFIRYRRVNDVIYKSNVTFDTKASLTRLY